RRHSTYHPRPPRRVRRPSSSHTSTGWKTGSASIPTTAATISSGPRRASSPWTASLDEGSTRGGTTPMTAAIRRAWPWLVLALAGLYHAATPGPCPDGWHGLGWRAMFDPAAPAGLRIGLALAVLPVVGALLIAGRSIRRDGLLAVAALLVLLRQVEIPGVEP